MTTEPCQVCKHDTSEQLYPGILKCSECGYVFAEMRLTDEELFAIYNQQFFEDAEFGQYAGDEVFFRKNFRLRLRELKKFIDPERHRRLLEIGSAYGFFLDEVRDEFASVEGIDVTDEGVRHAREKLGLNVLHADYLKHDYGEQKFDVVCMWDTIEHLRSPQLYIEKIATQTKTGALLALTTADIDSLNGRFRGSKWRMIHPPTHLHYFSSKTLTRLLDEYGFDVVYNRYCGFYRSIGQVAYNILVHRKHRPDLFQLVEKAGVKQLGFYLNLYDIMYAIARRR